MITNAEHGEEPDSDTGTRQDGARDPGAATAVFRVVIWWLLLIAVTATIVAAVFFWVYAFIPAIIMVVLYGLLLTTNLLAKPGPMTTTGASAAMHDKPEFAEAVAETGAAPTKPASDDDETEERQRWRDLERRRELKDDVRAAEEKASLKIALPIAGGLLVIAVILASVILHWRIAAIGGLVIFCYMLLVGGPFWLLTIDESGSPDDRRPVETDSASGQ